MLFSTDCIWWFGLTTRFATTCWYRWCPCIQLRLARRDPKACNAAPSWAPCPVEHGPRPRHIDAQCTGWGCAIGRMSSRRVGGGWLKKMLMLREQIAESEGGWEAWCQAFSTGREAPKVAHPAGARGPAKILGAAFSPSTTIKLSLLSFKHWSTRY